MEMHPEPFMRGTSEFMEYYGLLLDHIEFRYLDGFAYSQRVPVSEDQIPQRIARAQEVLEGKLWRDQLRDWDEKFKPASIQTHRELQSVDPDALSDEELIAYLTRCREHHAEMIFQHMRFTGAATIPIGDLLAHAAEWAGVPPHQVLAMMEGTAPVSAGASHELQQLIETVSADQQARELLESDDDPAEVLESLRALDSDAGRAVSDYLDLVGCRLLDGFDIGGRYALEMPDALLRAMRATVAAGDTGEVDVDQRIAEVRAQVPEEHRQQFDELLEEARTMYRIRDERGVFSDIWASGIMRRAAIAAGPGSEAPAPR
jgi:pyruvate,water dikinase